MKRLLVLLHLLAMLLLGVGVAAWEDEGASDAPTLAAAEEEQPAPTAVSAPRSSSDAEVGVESDGEVEPEVDDDPGLDGAPFDVSPPLAVSVAARLARVRGPAEPPDVRHVLGFAGRDWRSSFSARGPPTNG